MPNLDIKGALDGKNLLQVEETNGKYSLVDTENNKLELENLSKKTQKYRPAEDYVRLDIDNKLYEFLDHQQIISLYSEMQTSKAIPLKYNYMGKGGEYWVKMHQEAVKTEAYPVGPFDEIHINGFDYLEPILDSFGTINLFDAGAGSGLPALPILEKLSSKKVNYIPIDISRVLLDYSLNNVGQKLSIERIFPNCIDFENSSVANLMHKYKIENKNSVNIVLFAGGTIGNLESENQIRALRNLTDGLLEDDFLFVSTRIDNVLNRLDFPLQRNVYMKKCITYISTQMGLDENLVEEEFTYNETKHQREFNLVFKKDVVLNFKKIDKQILFRKGAKINLWIFKDATLTGIHQSNERCGLKLQYYIVNQFQPFIGYIMKLDNNRK